MFFYHLIVSVRIGFVADISLIEILKIILDRLQRQLLPHLNNDLLQLAIVHKTISMNCQMKIGVYQCLLESIGKLCEVVFSSHGISIPEEVNKEEDFSVEERLLIDEFGLAVQKH